MCKATIAFVLIGWIMALALILQLFWPSDKDDDE